MHNEIKISENFYYIGGSDRRIHLFENVYPLENGVSYNSYMYLDEKTLVLDTVDESVGRVYFDNIEFLLNGRKLDYLVVNHMEPDHAASIGELLLRHPETTIVINSMAKQFLLNFFPNIKANFLIVKEGDILEIGKHRFTFVMAPMVHWPEVMMTYELEEEVLFSADAFGTFGAVSGNIFAKPEDYNEKFLDEARRYYTNIVGKYGDQVSNVLKKAATLSIKMICPLHGPIHSGNLNFIMNPYMLWATYTPEHDDAVMIAYSSVYGDTANAVEILAAKLASRGVKNLVVYDVSKTDSSYLVSEAFRVKTIVLAATTYNAGVFVKMEEFLHDLANHKIRNRNIAFIENGSWAPAAKNSMKKILGDLVNITYLEKSLTIASSIKDNQVGMLDEIAEEVAATVIKQRKEVEEAVDGNALFKLTYGLFALITKDEKGIDNASINNSFWLVSDNPRLVLLSVNKANYSAETVSKTKKFNISTLSNEADFGIFKTFGFQSGREADKFAEYKKKINRSKNGLIYLEDCSNSFISCTVISEMDCGNHVLFVATVDEAKILSNVPSMTYEYYFANVKPKPMPSAAPANPNAPKKVAWVCKICGYTYVGDVLPKDFICPLCKHGAEDFEKVYL